MGRGGTLSLPFWLTGKGEEGGCGCNDCCCRDGCGDGGGGGGGGVGLVV